MAAHWRAATTRTVTHWRTARASAATVQHSQLAPDATVRRTAAQAQASSPVQHRPRSHHRDDPWTRQATAPGWRLAAVVERRPLLRLRQPPRTPRAPQPRRPRPHHGSLAVLRHQRPCVGEPPAHPLARLRPERPVPRPVPQRQARRPRQRPCGDAQPREQEHWPWPGGRVSRAPTVPGSVTPDHHSAHFGGSAPAHPSSATWRSPHPR